MFDHNVTNLKIISHNSHNAYLYNIHNIHYSVLTNNNLLYLTLNSYFASEY